MRKRVARCIGRNKRIGESSCEGHKGKSGRLRMTLRAYLGLFYGLVPTKLNSDTRNQSSGLKYPLVIRGSANTAPIPCRHEIGPKEANTLATYSCHACVVNCKCTRVGDRKGHGVQNTLLANLQLCTVGDSDLEWDI